KPELSRIERKMLRDHVEMGLIGKGNLRSSKPTKSTARNRIGIDTIAIRRYMRDAIGTMRSVAGALGYGWSRVGIGAAVQIDLAVAGDKGSVFVDSGFDRNFRAGIAEGFERFLRAQTQSHGPLCQPRKGD